MYIDMRIAVRPRFTKEVGPNKKLAGMCVYRGCDDRVVVVVYYSLCTVYCPSDPGCDGGGGGGGA